MRTKECRSWTGDGCDPIERSGSTTSGGGVNIAMKISSDGGVHWSPVAILVAGTVYPYCNLACALQPRPHAHHAACTMPSQPAPAWESTVRRSVAPVQWFNVYPPPLCGLHGVLSNGLAYGSTVRPTINAGSHACQAVRVCVQIYRR